jgi:flagellar biosynthetic protein FliR
MAAGALLTGGWADGWAAGALAKGLLSLRIAPLFAFAPPFSLTQVPARFRAMFGTGIAACLGASHPLTEAVMGLTPGTLIVAAAHELALGAIFVLVFQLAYGALYVAGRVLDIQAGFGLALLIDPSSQSQTPLIGTLFVYAAAAVFFAMGGGAEVLKILNASLDAAPLGTARFPTSLTPLAGYMSSVFLIAFGVAGGAILCLFLADLAIAALVRTAPQMNVLVLGFQVKTLLLLLVLPLSFGASGALLVRLAATTLQALPRLA